MRCPKCQRPLEDDADGPYICCADAPSRWTCRRCAKVSEGFAFPYGRCPHCGGELALSDGQERPELRAAALAAVRIAFEIELGGRAFYQRAAAQTEDPALSALFGRFAVMEGEHMETLARRYHLDLPDPDPEFRMEVAALYADVEHRPQDPANLFKIAIALERRAALFFSGRAEAASAGSDEWRLYRELAAEEREHAEILATEFQRWREKLPGLFAPAGARLGEVPLFNAAAMLLAAGDEHQVALASGDMRVTYGALRERAARAAAAFRTCGVHAGDRVAIKLPDGVDWVVAFLGALWCGAVAVPVNPRVPAPEWRYILDEAGFRVIVCEARGETPDAWAARCWPLADWRSALAAALPMEPVLVDAETPAFWCHSSGTSGKPKAVIHGHRFARSVERVSRERIGLTAADRLFASSRLFFAYPQANSLFAGLKLGATVVLDPQWPTPAGVAATVARERPTVLLSVPSLYRSLLHEGLAGAVSAAGVRLCVSAGEVLPSSLRAAWRKATGLEIVDGYGASETLVLVLTAREGDESLKPSPGVTVQPLSPEAAQAGAPTRLSFALDALALGYLDRPAAQAESFRDGCFCPADLFVQAEGGGWRFAGREDSLVKIRGRWVNLIDLEEALGAGLPGLREAAAVSVPDAEGIAAVTLFYVAREGEAAAVEAALRDRAANLPPHQRPSALVAIESLPRTPTGKLLRRALAERLKPERRTA